VVAIGLAIARRIIARMSPSIPMRSTSVCSRPSP
jgi:hypothetical protein